MTSNLLYLLNQVSIVTYLSKYANMHFFIREATRGHVKTSVTKWDVTPLVEIEKKKKEILKILRNLISSFFRPKIGLKCRKGSDFYQHYATPFRRVFTVFHEIRDGRSICWHFILFLKKWSKMWVKVCSHSVVVFYRRPLRKNLDTFHFLGQKVEKVITFQKCMAGRLVRFWLVTPLPTGI